MCPYEEEKFGHRHTGRTSCEDEGRGWVELLPRNAMKCWRWQQPPEAERCLQQILLLSPQKESTVPAPWSTPPAFRAVTIHFWCGSPPVYGALLQKPQETNIRGDVSMENSRRILAEWWTVQSRESVEIMRIVPSVGGHKSVGAELHFCKWICQPHFSFVMVDVASGSGMCGTGNAWRHFRQMCPEMSSRTTERVPQWFVVELSTSWSVSSTSPVAGFFLTLARTLISYENLYWWMRWRLWGTCLLSVSHWFIHWWAALGKSISDYKKSSKML